MPDLAGLLRLLDEFEVEYIIIGGAAMVIAGSSRLTQDLDVLYRRSPENLERLAATLRSANAHLRVLHEPEGVPLSLDAPTLKMGMNFTLLTDRGDLDIFGQIPGIGKYEDALPLSEQYVLLEGAHPMRALGIDGLIAAKRASGRPKDLDAIPELEAMRDLRRAGNS